MLAYLQGTLTEKQPPMVVIDVSGVAYEVLIPLSALWKLVEIGQTQKLYIQLIVREDAHTLYGFLTTTDKQFFNQLLRVSGIGPKMALAVLSGLSLEECYHAVMTQNVQAFVNIPGIGKKTAERLLIEMQDKVPTMTLPISADARMQQDAIAALQALGYPAREAQKAVIGAQSVDNSTSTEALIKKALNIL